MWLLGADAQIEHFPSYLDSECIKFLLEYAKLDIKRTEIHGVLKELRFKSRKDRIGFCLFSGSFGHGSPRNYEAICLKNYFDLHKILNLRCICFLLETWWSPELGTLCQVISIGYGHSLLIKFGFYSCQFLKQSPNKTYHSIFVFYKVTQCTIISSHSFQSRFHFILLLL